jgi:hypothetical protein
MAPDRARVVLFVFALAGAAASPPSALGQGPLPVAVEFDFGQIARFKNHPKAADTELAVAKELLSRLKSAAYGPYFPWQFQPGKARGMPRITFTLFEDAKRTTWTLHARSLREDGSASRKVEPLTRIVTKPGDLELLEGVPLLKTLPNKVGEWLDAHFLEPDSGQGIQKLVQAVAPLGECRILRSPDVPKSLDDAEGVLELDWDQYSYLSKSVFSVFCQDKNKSLVELVSVGGRKPGEYDLPPGAAGRKGLGIAVKHKKMNDAEISPADLPKLHDLSAGRVYLEEYSAYTGPPPTSRFQATDQ